MCSHCYTSLQKGTQTKWLFDLLTVQVRGALINSEQGSRPLSVAYLNFSLCVRLICIAVCCEIFFVFVLFFRGIDIKQCTFISEDVRSCITYSAGNSCFKYKPDFFFFYVVLQRNINIF